MYYSKSQTHYPRHLACSYPISICIKYAANLIKYPYKKTQSRFLYYLCLIIVDKFTNVEYISRKY